jgi:2-polyprenyl-3-methyl-5-hydroxy-6-metoxy-1,4-benzoquinol methylase
LDQPHDNFYEANAEAYFQATVSLDMASVQRRFLSRLTPGARILDAGCGSGRDTVAFKQQGFLVEAFDASPKMARLASKYSKQTCSVMRFQDLPFDGVFDAVWSCAALVHVPKRDIELVLRKLSASLKPNGIAYFSFIVGEGERTLADGRLYNSYSMESLRHLVGKTTALKEVDCWESPSSSPSTHSAPWLHFIGKKTGSSAML